MLLPLAAILAARCSPEDRTIDAPEGVDWIAVLRVTPDGHLAEAGSLRRLEPGVSLRFSTPSSSDVLVLGYGDGEIAALAGPDERPKEASEVVEPTACEDVLPPPRWSARSVAPHDAHTETPTASAPRLTADWITPSCQDVGEVVVETHCPAPVFCPVRITPSACGRTAAMACAEAVTSFEIMRFDDAICASQGPIDRTLECSFDAGAKGTICKKDGCEIRVRPMPPPLDVALARVTIERVAPRQPPGVDAIELHEWDVAAGFIYDVARIGGEIVVSSVADLDSRRGCHKGLPSRITFIDAERLSTRTASAPPCVMDIEPDPIGPGFLAMFGAGRDISIGRFDRRGVLMTAAQLREAPASIETSRVGIAPTRDAVFAAWDEAETGSPGSTRLVRLDLASLSVTASSTITWTHPWTGQRQDTRTAAIQADGEPPTILILQGRMSAIFSYDTDLGEIGRVPVHVIRNPFTDLGSQPVFQMLRADNGNFAVTISEPPSIHLVDDRCRTYSACTLPAEAASVRSFWFERTGQPIGVSRWPGPEGLVAVVGATHEGPRTGGPKPEIELTALIGRFDPRRSDFVPGTETLGFGIARDVVDDGHGRLWVSLPWAAEIVRVEPR